MGNTVDLLSNLNTQQILDRSNAEITAAMGRVNEQRLAADMTKWLEGKERPRSSFVVSSLGI